MDQAIGAKIKLASFWKHESKNGTIYYSSEKLGDLGKLLLFFNERRSDDRQPELYLFIAFPGAAINKDPQRKAEDPDDFL